MNAARKAIDDMIDTATQDGVDVLRLGIPTAIFIETWERFFGEEVPEFAREEIEREFSRGLPVNVAIVYWNNLVEVWAEQDTEF